MFFGEGNRSSNKRCSCPSRAQPKFFERSVTYLQRNGVIERIAIGLLHIVKPWFNFQKRQLIQFYFW